MVNDDGKKQAKFNSDGTGLINIQMRAKKIGATIKIDKTNGYKIELEI